jgi:tetratricopeptide (TPR) repeat protein
MQIIHKIDDFFFIIFPEASKGDQQSIINAVKDFYTVGGVLPTVSIEEDLVVIDVDTTAIANEQSDFQKVISLCEKGQYASAKPLLLKLLQQNPRKSEYHRIMGQILSDEGDQEEAINYLIDALRWDAKNNYALLMMGNIFAKYKDDVDTAMKYYDQALVINPNDNITLNNIGANLMQQGRLSAAKKYFEQALAINPDYCNTHYAMAMLAEMEEDHFACFKHIINAIKTNSGNKAMLRNSINTAFEVAKKYNKATSGEAIYRPFKAKLEYEGEKPIEVLIDDSIPTVAKLEIAEYHQRDKHLIKHKSTSSVLTHLIMHELVHLDLVIQARKENANKVFVSHSSHKSNFIKTLKDDLYRLSKKGIPEDSIAEYCTNLFNGLNSQVFNAPIDLFIEQYLYKNYEQLRPFQFISVFNIISDGIQAVTEKRIVELSPKEVLSQSKIYNIVGALQFKDLFGIDLIADFKASAKELQKAADLYEEYKEYKEDKEPGEEYELVQHWAEDLKLQNNFEIVDEIGYWNKKADVENLLTSIEEDPFGIETDTDAKDQKMKQFLENESEIGLNMAVVMYMVDALEFFKKHTQAEIKKIAFEIAMMGTQGIRPDEDAYKVSSIKGRTFTGYHLLAYYYVSWALAIPEMLSKLQLPYDDEYNMALTMHKPNK